jgi:beta-phosphoglucomutase
LEKEEVEAKLYNFYQLTSGSLPVNTIDEVERSKPHPDLYLLALKKFGFDAADCIAIEDSPNGTKAAKTAGIHCIGYIPKGRKMELPHADKIFTLHDEIVDYLGSLHQS